MTAINFPDSPSNGDTHVVGGVTYTYNNAETKWKTTINSNAFLPLTGGTVSGNIALDELHHRGDVDTNITFGTDEILFDTAGSERFRVGSAGQLGIGGATYGTSGQVLTSGGASAAPAWEDIPSHLTRMTEVATTSGVEIDVTGIPSGVRKILVTFDHVSNSGTDRMRLQIGDSGGIETSGYDSAVSWFGGNYPGLADDGSGFMFAGLNGAAYEVNGTLTLLNATGNKWVGSWLSWGGDSYCQGGGGTKTLSGELTQLRFENLGSNTFDLGNLTVFYEK